METYKIMVTSASVNLFVGYLSFQCCCCKLRGKLTGRLENCFSVFNRVECLSSTHLFCVKTVCFLAAAVSSKTIWHLPDAVTRIDFLLCQMSFNFPA